MREEIEQASLEYVQMFEDLQEIKKILKQLKKIFELKNVNIMIQKMDYFIPDITDLLQDSYIYNNGIISPNIREQMEQIDFFTFNYLKTLQEIRDFILKKLEFIDFQKEEIKTFEAVKDLEFYLKNVNKY